MNGKRTKQERKAGCQKEIADNMKKVLLLNPPAKGLILRDNYCCYSSKAGYYWPPIDLLVMSGLLRDACELFVIDAVVENISFDACHAHVCALRPDVILCLTSSLTFDADMAFLTDVKKICDSARVVVFGGYVLEKGTEILAAYGCVDAVVYEYIEPAIKEYMLSGDRSKVCIGSREHQHDVSAFSCGVPAHGLFPLKKYRTPLCKRKPFTTMLASFGCPYACSFCMGGLISYKKRDVKNVLDELEYVQSLGIREVMFMDSTFTADRAHVEALCSAIIEHGIDVTWTCNVHAATVNKALLARMKDAGCHLIQLGIETANNETLRVYDKKITREQVSAVCAWCRELGIDVLGYFMMGFPEESAEDIRETIAYACELNPTLASFSMITPDIGTRLWKDVSARRAVDAKRLDSSADVMGLGDIGAGELMRWKAYAYTRFYLRITKIWALVRLFMKRSLCDLFCYGWFVIRGCGVRKK